MSNSSNQSSGGGYYGGGYYYGEGYGDAATAHSRSIKDYLLILRERIWWLVVTVFVVFLATSLYTFNAPKIYRSVATVEILREKDRIVQFQDVVRQDVANAEDFNTQIRVLESASIIQAVDGRLTGSERAQFLAPYERGIDASLRGTPSVGSLLSRNRTVSPVRLSLVVNILYSHPDPEIAARVANYFAEEFIDFNRNKQIEGSMRAVDDLQKQVDDQVKKIAEIENRVADFKEKHSTLSVDRSQDIDNEQLINLNRRFEEDRRRYDEARTRWNQVQRYRDLGEPLWELDFIANAPEVPDLLNRVSANQIEVARLSQRFRAMHPTMIAATEQLQQTRRELSRAVDSAVSSVRNDYNRASDNFQNSQDRLDEKKRELIELDRIRPQYNAMMRDLEVSRQLYDHYYNRLQQAAVSIASEGQTARIIDRARPAGSPYKPNILLNLIIGLMLGSGLGLGLVFLLAILDDKVKTAFDIETTIGIPLVGIVPRITRIDAGEKARIVAEDADKHTVEAFRAINSALKLNEESKNAKVILSTSTIPSEGKSFVSTNLALTFANHGEKTIVIDGDLRMPNIAKSLDVPNRTGVLQAVAGELSLDDVIIRDYYPNMDLLVAGGRSKSPTRILSSDGFANLIHELRMRYDKIIIDSPPLAPVSDALNILPLVDGVLYVIRFNTVKRKTANLNIRRLREANVPIFGAVLNNLNTHMAGYYYSHYYDNSYKHYYLRGGQDAAEDSPRKEPQKV
ncbi:MAG: polysaccharide biosynthesis tyrosine autokinase [Opitutales bacterium]|nr:polysaccharide biosynthesis tyrosine autokinase [Opitutales bacterium]